MDSYTVLLHVLESSILVEHEYIGVLLLELGGFPVALLVRPLALALAPLADLLTDDVHFLAGQLLFYL